MSRPFAVIGFTVFLIAGLLYNKETGVTAVAFAVYAAALVVTLFIRKIREQRYLTCAFASGAVICALLLSSTVFLFQPVTALSGSVHGIKAVITSDPQLSYGNYYFTANATEIDGEKADVKLRLTFSSPPEASAYDEVSGNFMFYIPGSSSEDIMNSYKADGIFVAAYPENGEYTVNIIPDNEKPVGKTILDIRKKITDSVYRVLPDERGGLAVALIIGDKSGIPADILSNFRESGISHIISVSGFHLSLWAMFILEVLKKLKFRERLSSFICMFAVIGFMAISGFTYSVVRSGIMMLIFLCSEIIMRKGDSLNSLGFAITLIALANPFAIGSISLRLSVLSTLGIILYSQFFAPRIKEKTERIKNEYLRKPLRAVISSLMVTLSAVSFSLPVTLDVYGSFNFAVFPANIIAGPLSGAAIIINSLGALVGNFFDNSLNIAGRFGGMLCSLLIRWADFIADIEWLTFRVEKDESYLIICAVLAVCLFSLFMAYNGKSMPVFTCAMCAVVFVSSLLNFSFSERAVTRINVADCGNGTAVSVSKNGETLLLGCGGTEFLAASRISEALEFSGSNINAVFVPHESVQTSSCLTAFLLNHSVEKIYCGELEFNSRLLLKETEMRSVSSEYSTENFVVTTKSAGDKSVTSVRSADASILICYDPIEDYALFPQDFRSADVIITRADYPKNIENFGADLVVINAENTRGKLISDELNANGITAVSTAGNGNIIVKADDGYITAYR